MASRGFDTTSYAALVLALPFVSFLLLAVAPPLRRTGRAAGWLSTGAMGVAFLLAGAGRRAAPAGEALWSWIPADGGPMATVGLLVDHLSAAMLVLVTLVSFR